MTSRTPQSVVIIGAGPRGLSALERLVALARERNTSSQEREASDNLGEVELVIHLIDPYPPGAGIVWRTDQPERLLMNTTIAEQTIFPDGSCDFIEPGAEPTGPSMAEWYLSGGGSEPVDSTFPSRVLYGRYLRDSYARIRKCAPANVRIEEHPTRVESVLDLPTVDLPAGVDSTKLTNATQPTAESQPTDEPQQSAAEQLVKCADGTTIIASAVVLAVGHIPSAHTEERARLAAFARRSGGVYLPQGLPAEAPVAEVTPGSRVIVRGMGLNYFDMQTLFTHERGGRFHPTSDDVPGAHLRYERSRLEPLLFLGSRRGLPYRSKPISARHPRSPVPLRYFTEENIALLAGLDDLRGERKARARFNDQLWPLILADLRFAYYRTLSRTCPEAFASDPGRLREAIAEAVSRHLTRRTWKETHPGTQMSAAGTESRTDAANGLDSAGRPGRVTREAFAWAEIEEELVPDPELRLSLHALLNPLDGLEFNNREPGAQESFHEWMLDFLRADLDSSFTGPDEDPIKAIFGVLWESRLLLKRLIADGHIDRVSVDMEICGWFEGFVSSICDGPPPVRIAELLALAEAGIVKFIGPDMRIEEITEVGAEADLQTVAESSVEPVAVSSDDSDIFRVTSPIVGGEITGNVVIDAASPTNSVSRAADVLIRPMLERGQLVPARLTLDDGRQKQLNGLELSPRPYRTIDVDGLTHPRRFCLSLQLSSVQWGLAIAANPGSNARTLADSHAAAEAILDLVGFTG